MQKKAWLGVGFIAVFFILAVVISTRYNEMSVNINFKNFTATVFGKGKSESNLGFPTMVGNGKGDGIIQNGNAGNITNGTNSPIIENAKGSITLNYGKN